VELGGQEIAVQAAKNFRALRNLGVTVRKTIDTVIATRCIESGYELLHNDRDFDPFAKHLGLRVVVLKHGLSGGLMLQGQEGPFTFGTVEVCRTRKTGRKPLPASAPWKVNGDD